MIYNLGPEDIFKRIYGADWTANIGFNFRNRLNAPSKPFGICLLILSGKPLASGPASDVWGTMYCQQHCELVAIGNPQNVTNDATDPVTVSVEFTAKYAPDVATVLTT
jgi:hypothetical protein